MRLQLPRHEALWTAIEVQVPDDDISHDRYHLQRVYDWALRLAAETEADRDLAGAAALVHDLVNIPKHSEDRHLGGERSAEHAFPYLRDSGYATDEVEAICEAVRTCSWSRGLAPTGRLGVVLQDADRLDALGAIGIARVMACAQRMNDLGNPGRLYHPDDPLFETERPLDDRRQAVDHFFRKLFKVAESLHTPTARAEAAKRVAVMNTFLEALRTEV